MARPVEEHVHPPVMREGRMSSSNSSTHPGGAVAEGGDVNPARGQRGIVVRRLWWGAGQVGPRRSIKGAFRFAGIRLKRPVTVQCVTPSGLDIVFNYPSQMMPTLVLFGDLLEPELGMLSTVLGPGSVAVDVGSAIGTWTVTAAKTGARVHCCEPDRENLATLERNLQANGVSDQATVHRMGLGSAPGWGVLLPQERRYLNRIRASADVDGAGAGADGSGAAAETETETGEDRFPVLTVEAFAAAEQLDHIDVLKINTAGGERDVVEGCLGLLRRQAVTLLMVLDGAEVRPTLDEVIPLGYEMGFWDGNARRMVTVAGSGLLDDAPRGPMNRYILLRLRDDQDSPTRHEGATQAQ